MPENVKIPYTCGIALAYSVMGVLKQRSGRGIEVQNARNALTEQDHSLSLGATELFDRQSCGGLTHHALRGRNPTHTPPPPPLSRPRPAPAAGNTK